MLFIDNHFFLFFDEILIYISNLGQEQIESVET